MEEIINQFGSQLNYLRVENNDGKVWFVPFNNVKKGLELYQPSSTKGKILRRFLPYCKFFYSFLGSVGVQFVKLDISDSFSDIIRELFPHEKLFYSIFMGTPGVDNKPTIQIYTNYKILAYCKYSSSPRIINVFRKESEMLEYLNNKGVKNVPNPLCIKESNAKCLYLQSTRKSFGSSTLHNIEKLHFDVLSNLYKKTGYICNYEDSDYYKMFKRFKSNLSKLPFEFDSDAIRKAISLVDKRLSGYQTFSFYHGDFTPWNTYLNMEGKLELFDFEYARYTYPPMLDIFHFFTQVKLYESAQTVEEIFNDFTTFFKSSKCDGYFDDIYFSYLLYLIDIINLYIERDYVLFSEETVKLLRVRYELLLLCVRKCGEEN